MRYRTQGGDEHDGVPPVEVLGGASPAQGAAGRTTRTREGVRQSSSEGNKEWPWDHPEVMDIVVKESLKGTPSGPCLVIIHSHYLGKKIYSVIGSCSRGPRCPQRASSEHHKLLHLRCYLGRLSVEGEPERKSDESQTEPLYTNEGRDVMVWTVYIVYDFTSAVTGSLRGCTLFIMRWAS